MAKEAQITHVQNQDSDKIQRTTDHGWDADTHLTHRSMIAIPKAQRPSWKRRMSVVMQCLLYMAGSYTHETLTHMVTQERPAQGQCLLASQHKWRKSQKVPHLHDSYMQLTAAERWGKSCFFREEFPGRVSHPK